jgi:hypothetical protein
MDGILIGPGEGEKVSRGPRDHRILAELPELGSSSYRSGRISKASIRMATRTMSIRSTSSRRKLHLSGR